MDDHSLSVHERDGLFLDVVDLALLIPGYNGEADLISPGHRFVNLTKAASVALTANPTMSRGDLLRRIHREAEYGEYRELCIEILKMKRPIIK
jgi:hypothetical protein